MIQPTRPNSFERRDPAKLKPHPLNQKIYGDAPPSEEFLEATKEVVHEALSILPDNMVVSGHQRRYAGIHHKHAEVPVIVRWDWAALDPLEIERLLITLNKGRDKTVEQRAREAARLIEIDAELAARRKASTQFAHGGEKVSPPQKPEGKGRSLVKAAEAVGLSHPTAKKAIEVVKKIDAAESHGDTATAQQLRSTLEQNVSKAHRDATAPKPADAEKAKPLVDAMGNQVPAHLAPIFEASVTIASGLVKLRGVTEVANILEEHPGGVMINHAQLKRDLDNARRALRFAMPLVCPYCKAAGQKCKDCAACKGKGFVNELVYKNAPSELKGATAAKDADDADGEAA